MNPVTLSTTSGTVSITRSTVVAGGGATGSSFGGGSAASAKLEPVAFLIVREDGSVKLLPVAPPPATTVDRVIETVPEVVDKVTNFIEKQQEKKAQKKTEEDFAE